MILLLVLSLAALAYVYVGYPLLLRLIVRIRGARPIRRADLTPPLSLVISAFNEAAVIRAKIENALMLDYPREALEIVVVSDASSDQTDAIVAEYQNRGVTLRRQPERRGKTAGLNRTVPELAGELVVFSDANAIYEPDALKKLARNFADPEVGCVTGEARYLPGGARAADVGERVYWGYEMQVKRLETALGSMVGGDGAIYAIRRSLWRTLPEDAINDFLNPLQIVAAGWRNVYEPEAACYEETAGGISTEYRRRVRIVSRSWRAVFQARAVLNPFVTGLFAWSVVSHKLLRWLAPLFAATAVVGAAFLYAQAFGRQPIWVGGITLVAATAIAATAAGRRAIALAAYFVVINAASTVGVLRGSVGRVSGIWSTPRERHGSRPGGPLVPIGRLLQVSGTLMVSAAGAAYWVVPSDMFATFYFWSSATVLGYVYVGYPALLSILKRVKPRPPHHAAVEPTVCLFIAAHNEKAVIEAKLQNTLALDYPAGRLEIVVASDGSQDETNAIVARFAPRVRLLPFTPRRGKMATINEGMREVNAEIVVFSDANTFLDRGAIRALVRNFADAEVGAVSGDVVLVGDRAALARSEDLYYRYERWVQDAESRIGSMIGADGALYAIRRELFVAPPADTILDDMAIPMGVIRAGRRVVFEPAARAWEHGSDTAMEEFSRKARVIAGAMQFVARPDSSVPLRAAQVSLSLISHKALRWLSPAFGTVAFLSAIALANRSHGYAAAAIAQAVILGLGVIGCVPAWRRLTVVAIAHYFCLVQAAAAVGFVRGITGRQSVMWRRFGRVSSAEPVRVPQ